VSEDPSIELFEPHVSATAAESEPLVWAIDTRHLPLYWFPRECPRGTFWANAATDPADVTHLLRGSIRVHVIEDAWLERVRIAELFAYRFPKAGFEPHPEVGGYWLSRDSVEAVEIQALGDPVGLHAAAEIELRTVPNVWPLWNEVVSSTLEYSGMRLRNAHPPK
jgi:hypothetical protein